MSVIFIVLPLAVLVVLAAVAAYLWAARRGQFDDLTTPALRVLHDEESGQRPVSLSPPGEGDEAEEQAVRAPQSTEPPPRVE